MAALPSRSSCLRAEPLSLFARRRRYLLRIAYSFPAHSANRIRMALGAAAPPRHQYFVRDGLSLTAIGVAWVGSSLPIIVMRLMSVALSK